MLWITRLTLLWISQYFVLGRIYPGLSALWISGMWELASPLHPSGRTESCTLHILRMLFWCSRGGEEERGERVVRRCRVTSHPAVPLIGMRLRRACPPTPCVNEPAYGCRKGHLRSGMW